MTHKQPKIDHLEPNLLSTSVYQWRFDFSRQLRIGTALFWWLSAWVVVLLVMLVSLTARSISPAWRIADQSSFISNGMYLPEADAQGQPFRWTSGASGMLLPLRHGDGLLRLRLESGRVETKTLAHISIAGQANLPLSGLPGESRVYHMLIRPAMVQQEALAINITSPTFRVPNDNRELGMRLIDIQWHSIDPLRHSIGWLVGLLVLAGLGIGLIIVRDWPQRQSAFHVPVTISAKTNPSYVRPRLEYIDSLRGIAVLMVVIAHSWIHTNQYTLNLSWATQNLGMAAVGVNLFMVLSGFCLAYPLIEPTTFKPQRIKYFFQRRLIRIIPPYYAAIAVFAVLPFIIIPLYRIFHIQHQSSFNPPTMAGIISHMLFGHNLVGGFVPGLNGSFWSLELEVQFYLLFPLLIVLARRYSPFKMVLGVLFVTLMWRIAMDNVLTPQSSPALKVGLLWSAPSRLFEFALGIWAAVIVIRHPAKIFSPVYMVFALGCLWYACYRIVPQYGQFYVTSDIVLGLGFFFLVLAASQGRLNRLFTWRPLMSVGTISYSVYLIHEPFLREIYRWIPNLTGWTAFFCYTVGGTFLMLGIGYGFYRMIEAPSLEWGRRINYHKVKNTIEKAGLL